MSLESVADTSQNTAKLIKGALRNAKLKRSDIKVDDTNIDQDQDNSENISKNEFKKDSDKEVCKIVEPDVIGENEDVIKGNDEQSSQHLGTDQSPSKGKMNEAFINE